MARLAQEQQNSFDIPDDIKELLYGGEKPIPVLETLLEKLICNTNEELLKGLSKQELLLFIVEHVNDRFAELTPTTATEKQKIYLDTLWRIISNGTLAKYLDEQKNRSLQPKLNSKI